MAYVYRRNGKRWTLDGTLAPSERGRFARFGGAVAIEGNTLVIGAPWDDGWHGAAYVYERTAGGWQLTQRLVSAGEVGDRFGTRVEVTDGVTSLATESGTIARFRRVGSAWNEFERTPVGGVKPLDGAPLDGDLMRQVAALDAPSANSHPLTPATAVPPSFVRASDGTYEDRTEIRWSSPNTGPFLYKIYRRLASQPPASNVLIRVASQDDSLYADASGTPGVVYTYCVTVVDMANVEGPSVCNDGHRIIFPPTNFTASDATLENRVRLRWTDRSSIEAGYRIRRNGAPLLETARDVSVVDDTTAVPGTSYSYELIAFDAAGNTTAPLTDAGQSAFIAAPAQVSATDGQHTNKVVITWLDATALEVNYRVYRNVTGSGPAASPLATLPAGTTSYEDLTAVQGTTYDYCVAAVDAVARESARACDTGGIGILPTPTDVLATDGVFDDIVRITWQDASTTEDGFMVYRMPVGTTDSTRVANVGAGVTKFDDNGGAPGTTYTYCVVAFSDQGGRSIPVCDDGVRAVVLAPSSVIATDGAFEDRVDVTWESTATAAVLFKVYRGTTFIRSLPADRRSYSDDGGASGVTIAYKVTAVTALGAESPATADSGSRLILAPISVKATDGEFEDRVAITWVDRSALETGYYVTRRLAGTLDPRVRIATRPANSTAYVDPAGAPGRTYDYSVTAFQAYGPGRADTTESAAGSDDGSRALLAPGFVEASDGSFENQVVVTWVDNSRYEEAYHVWRRNTATNDSLRVAVAAPNSDRFVDASIAFGVIYEYSVSAVDSAGVALLGASPSGKDRGNTAILPPVSVNASDLYVDRVIVAWLDQSALETGYSISRNGVAIGSVGPNTTSFTDNLAVQGTRYTYCVRSFAGADSSQPVCDSGMIPSLADGDAISFTHLPPAYFEAFPNPYAADRFGWSIDGEGEWLVVGAPYREYQSGGGYPTRGSVTVLSRDRILPTNPLASNYRFAYEVFPAGFDFSAQYFGSDVAMSGSWMIATSKVGAPFSRFTAVEDYIFFMETGNNTSRQSVSVSSTDLGPSRVKVDIEGSHAVVGSSLSTTFWTETFTSPPWASGTVIPGATRSVAMSGSTALLGGAGSVRVCTRSGGGTWSVVQTLTPPAPDAAFGYAVDIDGDRAVVSSHADSTDGVVYVFERDGGGVWQLVTTLQPNRYGPPLAAEGGIHFGFSVSIRDESILVGAPRDAFYGYDPLAFYKGGAVFLYTREEGRWRRREVLRGPHGCTGCVETIRQRGFSVKITDSLLVAGDPNGATAGNHPYIESTPYPFDLNVGTPGGVTASDGTNRDKVQLTWTDNTNNEVGFKIFRDGTLIATTEPNVRVYSDFDAAPGRTHEYCVKAFLDASESPLACDFGRRPPDGNITGRVSTTSGTGTSDVSVCLDPSPNRALLFDGSDGNMTVPAGVGTLFGSTLTVELWYRGRSASTAALLSYSTPDSIDAFAVKNPANLALYFNGASVATGVDVNDGAWHHIAIDWTSATGQTHVYKDGVLSYTAVRALGRSLVSGGQLVFGASLAGALDDIRIWDHVRSQAQIQDTRTEFLTGTESGLVAYWPLSEIEGLGAEELKANRYGRLSAGANYIGEAPPMNACALSDVQGNYVLPELRYGTSTTFKVTPTQSGHQFEPAFKIITLSTGSPVQNEVGFTDITSYTLSGFVRYEGLSCVAANVPIYVDGLVRGTTDGSGRYAVPATPGAHTIEPRLPGHTFLPPSISLTNVTSDLADQSFSETTKRTLSGQVAGGCGVPIGTFTIKLDSQDGCYSRTFDGAGAFQELLPPLVFSATVLDVNGSFDDGRVLQFFDDLGTREVDLSAADQTLDFRYRGPLRVSIEGLPPVNTTPGCAITVPVVEQTSRYRLTIRVEEDYGTSTCPVDTGSVTVFDEIIDQEKNPVTLVVQNGQAFRSTTNGLVPYETAGNKPNIFAGRVDSEGNDRSYQKPISVVAEVEGQDPVTETQWVIVTGHRPRTATFTALSEGIPLFILRDPPGDNSFSSLAKESSSCTKFSNVTIGKFSTGFQARAQVGVDLLLGAFVLTKLEAEAFVEGGLEIGVEATSNNEMQVCVKTTEEFKTSTDKLYVGRDGDLFVGMAMNLLFAKTDVIKVEGCDVVASEDVTIGVDDIESVYTFTDFHIRNILIPQLEDLARLNPADSLRYNSARANWEAHLALSDSLKAAAPVQQNRSFSAGSEYSYSATVDTTTERAWSVNVFAESQFGAGFDFSAAGSGANFSYFTKFAISHQRAQSTTVSSSRTTGYTLTDDDIGDFFSVNVKHDPFYGTPVFDIVGGTSSCPWEPWPDPVTGEPRTQPVDGPKLTVQPPVRNNVPPDSPAVFILNLTNDSQNGDLREYQLFAVQESNPGGAVLRLDGDPFAAIGVSYFIPPGETRQATLTVERGPTQYFYENLKIVMVPPCEYDLFRSGGPLNLSHSVLVSVGFEAPCSDITLLRPNPGWSVQASTDSLDLILTGFELAISEEDSLVAIGAEYQRDGTDVWLPIGPEIPLASIPLGFDGTPQSVRVKWNVTNVPEATYTVRAFTRCPSGKNYSSPATGVIDRSAPVAFGSPQPGDGRLAFGENISITFNEDIDCATANALNVRLNVIGGLPLQTVECNVTCNGRTLVITPTQPALAALESAVLRATVENIKDAHGNPMVAPVVWEFDVRRSSFAWSASTLVVDAAYRLEALARSSLTNGTTADIGFTIENLPPWLTPSMAAGTVRAGESIEIAFTVADNLAIGTFTHTPNAVVRDGGGAVILTLPIQIRVDVSCVRPSLHVVAADFEHTMTFVSRVRIDGVVSTDRDDLLAAYVGNELRGVAHPDSISPGQWLYFLTVYSDRLAGETVRFQVWDDDACQLYTATDKVAVFESDKKVGDIATPFALATRIAAPGDQQLVAVNKGWTWMSLNRRSPLGLATNLVLGDLNPSAGDLIKTLGQFSTFDPSLGWQGTLDSLDNATGYMISLSEAGTIIVDGSPAFPSLTPIDYGTGWNWIGYVPQSALPVNTALGGFTARANGDVIKSQFEFAQFNGATSQWIGSLTTMEPGRGYKLYTSAAPGSFLYPNSPGPMLATSNEARAKRARVAGDDGRAAPALAQRPELEALTSEAKPGWQVDPRAYQHNMTITAELELEDGAGTPDGFQVAAVVNGEVRGIAEAQYVTGLGKHLVFLMVYSNVLQGETVSFRIYDPKQDAIRATDEIVAFEADRIQGTLAAPVKLRVGARENVAVGPFHLSHNFPNPFAAGTATHIQYSLPIEAHVDLELFDIAGRLVRTLVSGVQPAGYHEVTMESRSLGAGTYYYRLRAGAQVRVEKMTLLR